MNPFLHDDLANQDLANQVSRELAHFSRANKAFFDAWKRGVQLAGASWFGDGTKENFVLAQDKWDLCPNLPKIRQALPVLSAGEKMFLAAMVSVYNDRDGGVLLKRCGFHGLADFCGLDSSRRQAIADLIVHYNGW